MPEARGEFAAAWSGAGAGAAGPVDFPCAEPVTQPVDFLAMAWPADWEPVGSRWCETRRG